MADSESCPYCNHSFNKPPKRSKTCPKCKKKCYRLKNGRLGVEKKYQAECEAKKEKERTSRHKEYRAQRNREIKEAVKSGVVVGFRAMATSDSCPYCRNMSKKRFSLDDVSKNPDLMPPYDMCTSDFCRCCLEPVLSTDRSSFSAPPKSRKRGKRSQAKSSCGGCVGVALAMLLTAVATWLLW